MTQIYMFCSLMTDPSLFSHAKTEVTIGMVMLAMW
jgi:hypothetical protein